jgi:hypothetical protein
MSIEAEIDPTTMRVPVHLYKHAPEPLNNSKRPLQDDSIGAHRSETTGSALNTTRKRMKRTPEQLEGLQKVRAYGACLRCILQKAKVLTSNLFLTLC